MHGARRDGLAAFNVIPLFLPEILEALGRQLRVVHGLHDIIGGSAAVMCPLRCHVHAPHWLRLVAFPPLGIGDMGCREGWAIDIFAVTLLGAQVAIRVDLPGANGPVILPGVVRWVRNGGMGIQFGLMGAVETHLITEIGRNYVQA
mgnify:CR=1 FL=1